jgi:hypothetical protein
VKRFSSGCRSTSGTWRRHAGRASNKSLPWGARDTSPGSSTDNRVAKRGTTSGAFSLSMRERALRGEGVRVSASSRRISSIRIRIEDAIGEVKGYRIVKTKIRLSEDRIWDSVMETCSGVHNFRLQCKP